MNRQKLVIIDLDQTLIDSPKNLLPSKEFITLVKQIYPEYLVGCATGRAYRWTLPVLEATNFTAPCIIGGGATIVDQQNYQVIRSTHLSSEQLKIIKSILHEYQNTNLLFNDYTQDDYINGGWSLSTFMAVEDCTVMDIIGLRHETANELVKQLSAIHCVHAVKMNGYTDDLVDILVSHTDATKSKAIHQIQRSLSINIRNTIGIGNGYNDIEIFNAVGTKIAVSNAVEELKSLADIVIGDVQDDSVTTYLRTLTRL